MSASSSSAFFGSASYDDFAAAGEADAPRDTRVVVAGIAGIAAAGLGRCGVVDDTATPPPDEAVASRPTASTGVPGIVARLVLFGLLFGTAPSGTGDAEALVLFADLCSERSAISTVAVYTPSTGDWSASLPSPGLSSKQSSQRRVTCSARALPLAAAPVAAAVGWAVLDGRPLSLGPAGTRSAKRTTAAPLFGRPWSSSGPASSHRMTAFFVPPPPPVVPPAFGALRHSLATWPSFPQLRHVLLVQSRATWPGLLHSKHNPSSRAFFFFSSSGPAVFGALRQSAAKCPVFPQL